MKVGANLLCVAAVAFAAAAQAQNSAPGLLAVYQDGRHEVKLAVARPGFFLEAAESLHPAVAPAFEAEWRGSISILRAGAYELDASPGHILLDGREAAGPVNLDAGSHEIRISYRRRPGPASMRLEWSGPGFSREPVPASALSHDSPATPASLAERGRQLAEDLGCVNCHQSGSPSLRQKPAPALTGIGSRTNRTWLYHWLSDPRTFRAGAVMPTMLDEQGRRDVASYLAGVRASQLDPEPSRPPRRADVNAGRSIYQSLGCGGCHQREQLPLAGFGSKTTAGSLIAFLKNPAKLHPSGRMPSLMLTDREALQIAGYLLEARKGSFEAQVPEGDAGRGKELVEQEGCLNCHVLDAPGVSSAYAPPPALHRISAEKGCLAQHPGGRLPRYRLEREERTALQAFLRDYQAHPDISPSPIFDLRRRLRQFGCLTCHAFENEPPAAALPQSAPTLTGAGEKLRTGWLIGVLRDGKRVQQGLDLRMPDYHGEVAPSLAEALAKAAGVKPGDNNSPDMTADQSQQGHDMLGMNAAKGGLGCIGCHGWGAYDSLGEDGPRLHSSAERFRYEWFRRWMLDPARVLSGTSMPNYFGALERSAAFSKIDALWAGLAAGEALGPPEGFKPAAMLETSEAMPTPADEPIVVRWDMPEATPAAIAVGMPGGVSYCFDAGESRLRYAWTDGFVDLTPTLLTKKNKTTGLTETARVVGEIFYRAEGFPFRVGDPAHIPQRRFRGYRVVDGDPEFRYEADGVEIRERIVPTDDQRGIVRHFRLRGVNSPMWFVSQAAGAEVESDLGPFDGNALRLPAGPEVRFQVRVKAGRAAQ